MNFIRVDHEMCGLQICFKMPLFFLQADENELNEWLVLNSSNKLADASKANIFIVLNNEVHTPALHQGCVNGVKRRFIIEELKKGGIVTRQTAIDEALLLKADEVFFVECNKRYTMG